MNKFKICLTESDFPEDFKDRVTAHTEPEIFGLKQDIQDYIQKKILEATVKKIQDLDFHPYKVSELTLTMKVEGNAFGVKIGGDVSVKLLKPT